MSCGSGNVPSQPHQVHILPYFHEGRKNQAKHRVCVLAELYNNTLAEIITKDQAYQASNREEREESFNSGHYHLPKELHRKIWLP